MAPAQRVETAVQKVIHLDRFAGEFIYKNQLLAFEMVNAGGVRSASAPAEFVPDGIPPLGAWICRLRRGNARVADDADDRHPLGKVELQPAIGFQKVNLARQSLLEPIHPELME